MIAEHPIIGIGESMFAYSHHAYTGVGSAPGLLRARPTLFDQTHNLYLQTAAEIGVPGAAALITILVSFWITGLRRLKSIERSDRRYLLMGSLGATVAFAVDAFTSPSWQFGQLMILFWLSLGLGVASMRQSSSRSVRRTQHLITVPSSFRRPAEALGLLGLAALMPPTVVASTRLNSYYPSTVYGAVNGTIQRVEIRVFNPSNQDQTVKSGPQYRLQLEVYLHEKSTIRDGGSVTLDPGTHWSAQAPNGTNTGTFTPEPSRHPVHEGGTINGNSGDYIAYSNTSGDAGRAVTIVATYMGFKATALLDFSNTVKPSTPPAGAGTAESRSTSNSTSIIPSK
jgi:hypothetical protein